MRRAAIVALLSIGLGLTATIGVADVCSNPDQAWAKRVHDIVAWNESHPDVVKRRHLDRDMSAETRRMKARIYERFARDCVEVHQYGQLRPLGFWHMNVLGGLDRIDDEGVSEDEGIRYSLTEEMEAIPSELDQLLPEDHPVYEQTFRPLPNDPPFAYLPHGFSPGYLGGGGLPYRPSGAPSVPVAPTPEPMTFGLVAVGVGILGFKRFKR